MFLISGMLRNRSFNAHEIVVVARALVRRPDISEDGMVLLFLDEATERHPREARIP